MKTTITFTIHSGMVERYDRPLDIKEARRVIDAIKTKYQLGWAGLAVLFGMPPTAGGANNVKKWINGKADMPKAHYYTALMLLDEFHIEINHVM